MLRHRLETEEHTSGQLREDLKHQKQKSCGLDEQLKTLMMLVKPDDTQYASTPMNGGIDKKGREKLDFKTPLSRFEIPLFHVFCSLLFIVFFRLVG